MHSSARSLLWEVLFTRPWARVAMIALTALATSFGLLGPLLQKNFLDQLSGSENFSFHAWPWLATLSPMALLFSSFVCLLLSLALYQGVIYLGSREAIWMQRKLSQRVYNHTLELRSESLHGRAIGDLVSVYTVDIPGATILLEQSLPQGLGILFPLILAPWLLVEYFGISFVSIFPLLLGIFALNFLLALRQSRFFFHFKRLAAERVGFVNEWIQNLRTLRILGWVAAFEERIFKVRVMETKNRVAMLNNGQTMNAIASSITFVLNVYLVTLMVNQPGVQIVPGTLLALLWIVAVFLTRPFRQMPWFFTFVFDAWTSMTRVADLLDLKNQEHLPRSREFQKLHALDAPEQALRVKNLSLEIKGLKLLDDISFEAKVGEFLAIVGEVGSGKSLLQLSLMGETSATFDEYWVGGNDARKLPLDQLRQFFTFVPQEGFIMSGTLRENIEFEYGVNNENDEQIKASLARAQFDLNHEHVAAGLDTEIGERGVNLSGGQKQRVSLARVDYIASPIILLDDCLSALDVDTEKKLIRDLLAGVWGSRTRLLVTHRLSVLKEVDRILFLENGKIRAEGTFQSLLKTSAAFREYTTSLARTEEVSTMATAPTEPLILEEVTDESKRSSDSI